MKLYAIVSFVVFAVKKFKKSFLKNTPLTKHLRMHSEPKQRCFFSNHRDSGKQARLGALADFSCKQTQQASWQGPRKQTCLTAQQYQYFRMPQLWESRPSTFPVQIQELHVPFLRQKGASQRCMQEQTSEDSQSGTARFPTGPTSVGFI